MKFMVTAVCGTKPDLKVRKSSVGLERVWSTSGPVQFVARLFPRTLIASRVDHYEPWTISKGSKNVTLPILTHTLSYIARTHSMLPVQLSTTSFIHALSGCAIFNMIKKKKKKTKRWILVSSQLQHVERTEQKGPGKEGEVLGNERRLPSKLQY